MIIQPQCSSRSRGARDTFSSGPKFLNFHAVLRKKWSNNGLASPSGINIPSGKSWICHCNVYDFTVMLTNIRHWWICGGGGGGVCAPRPKWVSKNVLKLYVVTPSGQLELFFQSRDYLTLPKPWKGEGVCLADYRIQIFFYFHAAFGETDQNNVAVGGTFLPSVWLLC